MKKELVNSFYEIESPSGVKYHLTLMHRKGTYTLFTKDEAKIDIVSLNPKEIGYIKDIVEFALRELGFLPPQPKCASICSEECASICSECQKSF